MAKISYVISAVTDNSRVKSGITKEGTRVESSSTFASQSRRVHNGLLLIYLRAPSLHFSSSFRPSSCCLRPRRQRRVVREDAECGVGGGGRGGEVRWSPTQKFRVPRLDSRDSGGEKNHPLFSPSFFFLLLFFFRSRISPKGRGAAVKYFVVTELDVETSVFFFFFFFDCT